jgi:antitoxin MazE
MKTRIVAIGNSQGIRIPKPLLEETGLEGEVEVTIENSCLVVRSAVQARTGWDTAFAVMSARGDDALIGGESVALSSWDEEEWQWK